MVKHGKTRLPNYRKKGPGRRAWNGHGRERLIVPASVLESAKANRLRYMHASARRRAAMLVGAA